MPNFLFEHAFAVTVKGHLFWLILDLIIPFVLVFWLSIKLITNSNSAEAHNNLIEILTFPRSCSTRLKIGPPAFCPGLHLNTVKPRHSHSKLFILTVKPVHNTTRKDPKIGDVVYKCSMIRPQNWTRKWWSMKNGIC